MEYFREQNRIATVPALVVTEGISTKLRKSAINPSLLLNLFVRPFSAVVIRSKGKLSFERVFTVLRRLAALGQGAHKYLHKYKTSSTIVQYS